MNENWSDKDWKESQGTQGNHEANGANGTNGANGANGNHETPEAQEPLGAQRKPLEPQPFLPKKGNYRDLLVYQKAKCLYDITFFFAQNYFVARKDRTVDQVVQAARSGKQNIAEGCSAGATSSEMELKLLGVARASMQEVLADYEDYLRTRGLQQWPVDDPRTHQTQEYCKKHYSPLDYTKDIDRRSPEAICNIAITLIHQYDTMMGNLIDRLQKDFVEEGGIRERSRPRGLRGLIGLIGLMGLMGLMGCSSESTDTPAEEPTVETGTPIALSTNQQAETVVTRAGLEEKGVTAFTVFGYKNYDDVEDDDDNYDTRQTVFPGYTVSWTANSANTSTTNTNSWEYVDEATEQTIKYWDWGASAYRFFGVTGSVNSGHATGTRGKYGTYGNGDTYELTITADGSTEDAINATPYISHLWFSNGNIGEDQKEFGKPVQLEFLKPLSTVRFMFTFEDPKDAATTMLTQKSFRPTNGSIIKTRGDITISYPLTGPTTKEWFTYLPGEGGLTDFTQDYYEEVEVSGEHVVKPYFDAPDSLCNYIYTVLPASNQGTYTLSVSVNGDPKTTVVPAEFMDWKLGYLYTYIFKIHVDGSVEI